MSFSVGIVGMPNVGKSTLFKALTKKNVGIAPRPFTTIEPNIGTVQILDHRLDKIAKIINPAKTTYATIEFVDIAGLVKGAHQGQGLGNQFLAQIKNCDAILEVVKVFSNQEIKESLSQTDPQEDIEIIKIELLMKDMEALNNSISKLEKKESKELLTLGTLKRLVEELGASRMISEIELNDKEKLLLKDYQTLTVKPILYILNTDGKVKFNDPKTEHLLMDLKQEQEITELNKEEKKELGLEANLDKLIKACYNRLNLITFFTVAGFKEAKAWTIAKGSNILEAGGAVHSDFRQKFIRAQVLGWQDLIDAGSWSKAREKGLINTTGKDYLVQDGDVIEFKI